MTILWELQPIHTEKKQRKPPGWGLIKISDDFDEPLENLKIICNEILY